MKELSIEDKDLIAQQIFNQYGSALSKQCERWYEKVYGADWKYIKNVYKEVSKSHNEIRVAANRRLGGVNLLLADEEIAKFLLKRLKTANIVLANAPWLSKYFGRIRFENIRRIIKLQLDDIKESQSSVHEESSGTIELTKKKKSHIIGGEFQYYSVPVDRIFTNDSGHMFYAIKLRRGDIISDVNIRALSHDKHQYKTIVVACNREIARIDEYWAYKNLFKVGTEYLFTVEYALKFGKKYKVILKDKNGLTQECISSLCFEEDQKICCTVAGFRKMKCHERSLVLENPRRFRLQKKEENLGGDKIIYYGWYNKLHSYSKHICGKSAVCSCCKNTFEFRQGYRFEGIDAYLCMECYDGIFPPKQKKPRQEWVRFINTNMGHKK